MSVKYGTTPTTGAPVRSRRNSRPGVEQGRIAAELVDHVPADERPLLRLQQLHRPDKLGEDSAAVDVAHQQHRRLGMARDPHVDDVVLLEVDLRGAPGALDHHDVELRPQADRAPP